jgi:hypothetical protein
MHTPRFVIYLVQRIGRGFRVVKVAASLQPGLIYASPSGKEPLCSLNPLLSHHTLHDRLRQAAGGLETGRFSREFKRINGLCPWNKRFAPQRMEMSTKHLFHSSRT